MKKSDSQLIRRCFELATDAAGRGDTAVGSVLVTTAGEVVAQASERNKTAEPFAHAEFLAIRDAMLRRNSVNLSDCELFTTHEPCFMCSFAIRRASISRVVFARPIEGVGGITSAYPILTAKDIPQWAAPPSVVRSEEFPPNSDAFPQ